MPTMPAKLAVAFVSRSFLFLVNIQINEGKVLVRLQLCFSVSSSTRLFFYSQCFQEDCKKKAANWWSGFAAFLLFRILMIMFYAFFAIVLIGETGQHCYGGVLAVFVQFTHQGHCLSFFCCHASTDGCGGV